MKDYVIKFSGLAPKVKEHYTTFQEKFGVGMCAAYCTYKKGQNGFVIAVCEASKISGGEPFTHYVLIRDNNLVDETNPFDQPLTYNNIKPLLPEENPIGVSREMIEWLKKRL